jgi:dihydroorotate dehydrogenase
MAERMVEYKKKKNWRDFTIVGVGGVTKPEDYQRYMNIGVNAVQSATGAMWNPNLAMEIRKNL